MRRGKAMHQKSMRMELALGNSGEAPRDQGSGEAGRAAQGKERSGNYDLMERVVVRANAVEAFKRVRRNKGSPGIAGRTVAELEPYLRENWGAIREQLLVVGGGSRSHAYRSAGELLRAARSAPACCTDLNSLNRRMRIRMSGGVGGE